MIVYICMIIIIVLLSLRGKTKFENKIFIFLVLFLVMGLRYGVGQDYFFTYKPVFEIILETGKFENIEYGYVLLNKFVQFFSSDYAWIFIVTSFIYVYFIVQAIFEQSENIPLSFFLLTCGCFYFYAMNIVRQSIAIAIFMYALKYIKEKKLKNYMFLILLASSIHKIALIFLPIYWFANMKISKKKFFIITCGLYLLIPIMLKFIGIIFAGTKYGNYITGYYRVSENSMISPLINVIILVACFLLEKSVRNDRKLNIYKNIHILGFWCTMFLGRIPLVSRIFVNFYQIQILSIPLIISKFQRKDTRKILYIACIIAFTINFVYSIMMKNGNKVLPYNWIFNR